MKTRYTFGHKYMEQSCKFGIAMVQGERYYIVSDRYTYWLITDMDPVKKTYELKVWDKARSKKAKRRPSHARNIHTPHARQVRL